MAALPENTKARAVIFDLDGTLIDTLDDITDSMNVVFEACGYAVVKRERARRLVGEGLAILLERASGETDRAKLSELVDRYRAVYRERMFERTRLYDGVGEMLDELTAGRVPMCVLSNKPDEFTVPICERLLQRWTFQAFRGSGSAVLRKPDPTESLRLCSLMGHAPEQSVFVGDSDIDVLTAHNAGMKSIGVTWGFRDRSVLEAAKPHVLLDTPREVSAWILGG